MKKSIIREFFALSFVFSVLLALPSYLLPQEIDQSSGLREIKPGCYVYLHRDDSPGVSSTFNNAVIVTKEGALVMDAQRTEVLSRQVRGITRFKQLRALAVQETSGRFRR